MMPCTNMWHGVLLVCDCCPLSLFVLRARWKAHPAEIEAINSVLATMNGYDELSFPSDPDDTCTAIVPVTRGQRALPVLPSRLSSLRKSNSSQSLGESQSVEECDVVVAAPDPFVADEYVSFSDQIDQLLVPFYKDCLAT